MFDKSLIASRMLNDPKGSSIIFYSIFCLFFICLLIDLDIHTSTSSGIDFAIASTPTSQCISDQSLTTAGKILCSITTRCCNLCVIISVYRCVLFFIWRGTTLLFFLYWNKYISRVLSHAGGVHIFTGSHLAQCGDCPHCGQMYNNQSSLKYHVRLMHSDLMRRLCCYLCPSSFVYREAYKTHMRQEHNVRLWWMSGWNTFCVSGHKRFSVGRSMVYCLWRGKSTALNIPIIYISIQ